MNENAKMHLQACPIFTELKDYSAFFFNYRHINGDHTHLLLAPILAYPKLTATKHEFYYSFI